MAESKICEYPPCNMPFYREDYSHINWKRQRYCSPACAKAHYNERQGKTQSSTRLKKKCACGCGKYFEKPAWIIGKNWDHVKYMNVAHQQQARRRQCRTVTFIHHDSLHTKHVQDYLCPSPKWERTAERVQIHEQA